MSKVGTDEDPLSFMLVFLNPTKRVDIREVPPKARFGAEVPLPSSQW
jgi:hypothetical protein